MDKQISSCYPQIKDCYWIKENGEVYNKDTGNILSQYISPNGYKRVSVMKKEGGTTILLIHRILLMSYNPIEEMDKLQVNHIDGNKLNNNLNNLEWVTSKENIEHSIKTGLTNFSYLYGEKTNFAKHTEQDALQVIELLKTNQYRDAEIIKLTGFSRSFIEKIRTRQTWTYLTKDIPDPFGKTSIKFND